MTADTTPSNGTSDREPNEGSGRERRTLGLVGLLLELTLPVVLSAALLLVAASYIHAWDLRTSLGLAVFGVLLVAASVIMSVRIDVATLARRQRRGTRQLFNRAGAYPRLFKFILGGLVIPIAVFVAANRIELADHASPMSLAIEAGRPARQVVPAELVGGTVLRATDPEVKVQGIMALQAMNSNDALDQLLRILDSDLTALRDGGESHALSKALASFGTRATPALVERFEKVTPVQRKSAPASGPDVFDRYFASAFEQLGREINGRASDPAAIAAAIARMEAAARDLKLALKDVDPGPGTGGGGTTLPAFVLQTFLQMTDKEDGALLAFARRTAADNGWSDGVRGQTLLLIARLGGKADLDGLYRFLDAPSPLLQARALQAIAAAQAKVAPAGSH